MKRYYISKWYTNINGSHCMGYEIVGNNKAIATSYLKYLNDKNTDKFITFNLDWIWNTDPVSYITTNSKLIVDSL